MKECTNCSKVREDFSPQKTKPSKLYSWCDECRESNVRLKTGTNKSYTDEIQKLRQKAVQLRSFSPEQADSLRNRYNSGVSVKELSVETGKSKNSIYSAIKGYTYVSLNKGLKTNPFA